MRARARIKDNLLPDENACAFVVWIWNIHMEGYYALSLSHTRAEICVYACPRAGESALSLGMLRNTPSFSLSRHKRFFFLFSQFINIKMWCVRERRAAKGTTKE